MNTTTKRRIRIFISIRQSLMLAEKIYEKHKADGEESLLAALEGFSWEATGPKISFCLQKHKEAIVFSKKAEEIIRQRDAALAEISDIIRASKSFLKNKYYLDPEKLVEWGFFVHEKQAEVEKVPP